MDAFNDIAPRLGRFIRLLASDRDGEVLAAARAIHRTLTNAGSDLHALAERIEKNGRGLDEAEMQRIYSAGFSAGVEATEEKQIDDDGFRNLKFPSVREMAVWLLKHRSNRLTDKELKFVEQMRSWWKPTERQTDWMKSIYSKLGGV